MRAGLLLALSGIGLYAQALSVCDALDKAPDGARVWIVGVFNPQGAFPLGFPRIDGETPTGLCSSTGYPSVIPIRMNPGEPGGQRAQALLRALRLGNRSTIRVKGTVVRTWPIRRWVTKLFELDPYREYPAYIQVAELEIINE